MVAASAGAGDEVKVRRATRMGLWLSLGFAILSLPGMERLRRTWMNPWLMVQIRKPA